MSRSEFHDAFASALDARDVSLSWLHQRLAERGRPVSVTALSYWRSGRSRPDRDASLDALAEIERLLDLDPGSLSALIGPSRRPGPKPGRRASAELFRSEPGIRAGLAALGFEGMYDEVVEQVRHLSFDVDADGQGSGAVIQAIVEARRDGARRTPLLSRWESGEHPPRFIPGPGCAIGRVHFDEQSRVFVTELLLDRELAKGQSCMYELEVRFSEPTSDTFLSHFAARRMSELCLWVRFDPRRVPSAVETFAETDRADWREPIDLRGGATAHVLRRGFGPGRLGIRWEW